MYGSPRQKGELSGRALIETALTVQGAAVGISKIQKISQAKKLASSLKAAENIGDVTELAVDLEKIESLQNIADTPLDEIVEGSTSAANGAKTVPQQLTQEGQVPAIGKMKDLNTPGNVGIGEFKVADYLPDMGNPQANWKQNSGILRSVMNENIPIKDVSMFPMDNAGFLGAERNWLQSRGWTYLDGHWYPPQ